MKLMCANMLYISCTSEQITLSEISFLIRRHEARSACVILRVMHYSDVVFVLKAKNDVKTLETNSNTVKHLFTEHVIDQSHEFVSWIHCCLYFHWFSVGNPLQYLVSTNPPKETNNIFRRNARKKSN